uniref:Toxin-antitoxin system HicB family antitoxin n=1 Tax=Steinernema glaseri TaxID=37863 RepID=A0A1I7Z2X4_9BILA
MTVRVDRRLHDQLNVCAETSRQEGSKFFHLLLN